MLLFQLIALFFLLYWALFFYYLKFIIIVFTSVFEQSEIDYFVRIVIIPDSVL